MTKNKKIVFILFSILLMIPIILLVNYLIPHKPKAFLTNKEIMKEIKEFDPEYDVNTIQDHVFIDKKHVFVPYLSKENDYGIINWSWNKNDWEIASIETNMFGPLLWKIESNHSIKYYLLWNMNPSSQLQKINFYLTRERQYFVSNGVSKYEPKIQMKFEKELNERSYGVLELPKNWENIMNDETFSISQNQSNLFFSSITPPTSFIVKWLPLDKNNKTKLPINSDSGHGTGNGGNQIDFVQLVNEGEEK